MKRGGSHRILHGGHNVAPANHLQGGGGGGDILPAVCGQIGNPNCGGGSRGVVAGGRMGHHNGGRKTATRRSRRGGFRANLAVGHMVVARLLLVVVVVSVVVVTCLKWIGGGRGCRNSNNYNFTRLF